ncbi:MAG: fimbrillin family protein [Mediterranea sp.]|jgi:hypothetical protein|nr:fimbrillin family protein [Mediterranea sp.]
MKTKKQYLYGMAAVAAAICLALASCGKDEPKPTPPEPPLPPDPPAPAAITAHLTAQTDDDQWTWGDLDNVGVYMFDLGTLNVTGESGNVGYKVAAGKGAQALAPIEGQGAIMFPLDERLKVEFMAYMPYQAGLADLDWQVPVDVKDQSSQRSLNLMWAGKIDNDGKGYTRQQGETPVPLKLQQQMSFWQVTVVKGEAGPNLNGLLVSIPALPTHSNFDVRTGTMAEGTEMLPIAPLTLQAPNNALGTSGIYGATLIPQNISANQNMVQLTTSDGTVFSEKLIASGNALEKGKLYEYTITLYRDKAVISNATIKDWTEFSGALGGDAY